MQLPWRHGDVKIDKVELIPLDAKLLKNRKELAYGEVTGHAHRIDIGELFETKNGVLYLQVKELAKLTHEEHKVITLEPGCYRVSTKRQYTPNGWESVKD